MKRLFAISLAALSLAATVSADELEKKIDIDREVVPELRAASRPTLAPSVISPVVTPVVILEANYLKGATIPNLLNPFDPAPTDDAIPLSLRRGYVEAGLFPAFNADLSAGYRFIQSPSTTANAWVQYNLRDYKRPLQGDSHDSTFNDNTVAVGADFTHRFEGAGTLSIAAGFDYSRFNLPYVLSDSVQRFCRFGLAGGWQGAFERFDYSIGARYSHASFSKGSTLLDPLAAAPGELASLPPLAENLFDLTACAATDVVQGQRAALGVRFLLDNYNHGAGNVGLLDLNPSYTFRGDIFEARLGMKVDFSINSGRSLAVAPDFRFGVSPSPMFNASLSVGGGLVSNSLGSLFDECHYLCPSLAYGNSRLPLDVKAALGFGPFRGAYLEVFGGYAAADSWLMPTVVAGLHTYEAVDIKGWHIGAKVVYDYGSLVHAEVSFEGAPSSYTNGYYLWRDRAKSVFSASVEVRPTDRVSLSAGYSLRSGRTAYVADPDRLKVDLRTASNLHAGARYAFNPDLSVFLRLENLLANRHYLVAGVPSQGLTGLAGVAYKF